MYTYIIFYIGNKKFPYTLLKLHTRGETGVFYGKEYDEEYFKEFLLNRAFSKTVPHYEFEAPDDESAILYYETMKDEVQYAI